MSYCVNCGVNLEKSRKKCPLCNVPVINPYDNDNTPIELTFADNRDEHKKAEHGFWIKFNSILAAVPIAISLLCNLLYDKKITWSLFVMAGVFIIWSLCSSPFFFKKPDYKKIFVTDFAGIVIGLGSINLVLQQKAWFVYIALPIALYTLLFWLAAIFLIHKGFLGGLLRIVATVFAFLTVLMLLIETLTDLYATGTVTLVWSWFTAASGLSTVALMILLDSNKAVKQELAKRLHF